MIFVDKREKKSSIPQHLDNLGAEYELRMLDVGDYIVSGYVIERKTTSDFASSLVGGRLDTQLYEMSKNFKISYLAVIGNVTEALMHRDLKRSIFFSKLASAIVKRAPTGEQGIIQLLQFVSSFDFALFLTKLEKKITEFEEEDIPRLPEMKKVKWSAKHKTKRILASIPGVGPIRAENLLRKFGTVCAVATAQPKELREDVDNVGEKTAEKIYNLFHQEYEGEKNA